MATPARRDELLEQIRSLPIEDREYIGAALMREAYESGHVVESDEVMEEIMRRAVEAVRDDSPGYSIEETMADARSAIDEVRARKR